MTNEESKLYVLLNEIVLPNLNRIQNSQAEQRVHTDRLSRSLEEFRTEMLARFTNLHAELAATRHQMDVAMVNLRETEARVATMLGLGKNQIIH